MFADDVDPDPLAEQRGDRRIACERRDGREAAIGEVAQPRAEPEPEHGGQREHMVGRAACIGIELGDVQRGPVVHQPVQDIGCLVHRRGEHGHVVWPVLVGDVGVEAEPRIDPVFRVDVADPYALAAAEELPVRTGGGAVAPHRCDRQAVLGVDQDGERAFVAVLADIGVLGPGELVAGYALAGGRHAGEPEVGGIGQIRAEHGLRSIETIKPGDMVLSRDEKAGHTDYRRVTAIKTPTQDELYTVDVEVPSGQAVKHHANFKVTANHPWRTVDGRWVQTSQLQDGMKLVRFNGAPAQVDWVRVSCPRLSGPSTMIVWTMKGTMHAEHLACDATVEAFDHAIGLRRVGFGHATDDAVLRMRVPQCTERLPLTVWW